MSDDTAGPPGPELVFEADLDAPPEKVWRALSIPAFREAWLPAKDLADAEPLSVLHGSSISYRMREAPPPGSETVVTFQLAPAEAGGTRLRILHGFGAAGHGGAVMAANCNARPMRRAA